MSKRDLENKVIKLESEVVELESDVKSLRNQLYELLDNKKIDKMIKKHNVKIEFKDIYSWYGCEYSLRINDKIVKIIGSKDKHEYIQSSEFEKDIKLFLFDRKNRKKKGDK